MSSSPIGQDDVAAWFDAVYARRGWRYLRPAAAYPIYLQLLGARAGERLLDIGCGPGLLVKAAAARGITAAGIDIAVAALRLGCTQLHGGYARGLARANAEQLPFADSTFDHVTCIGALERFLDRGQALAEMRRVLRPAARLCLMVRNAATVSWTLRLRRARDAGAHADAKTLDQWQALLREAGFVIDAVHADQWLRQKLRRMLRGMLHASPREPASEPVAAPLLPLRWANEFIFLLRPRGAA